jgi:hypothetical protein
LWSFGVIFAVLVCLDQEKSGNPAWKVKIPEMATEKKEMVEMSFLDSVVVGLVKP